MQNRKVGRPVGSFSDSYGVDRKIPRSYSLTQQHHDFITCNGGSIFLRRVLDDLMLADARIADEIRIDYEEGMKE